MSELSVNGGSKLLNGLRSMGLPEELALELIKDHLVIKHPKDSRLYLPGTPADMLVLIVSGAIKVYCPNASGRNFMVKLAGPGDVIGNVNFRDAKKRSCHAFEAQALTNCSVALISRERLKSELMELPSEALIDSLHVANMFWTSLLYRCAVLLSMTYQERLEVVISEIAENFGVKDARGTLLTLELSHDEWAELIGSSRSLVSKLISEMIDEGTLQREGRRYILLKDELLDKARIPSIDSMVLHAAGNARRSVETIQLVSAMARPAERAASRRLA